VAIGQNNVIYAFTGGNDGAVPFGGVIFDSAGKLYGTTTGYQYGAGTVFRLTPSGLGWTEDTLYAFQGGSDGASPFGAPVFDPYGNLYGSTTQSGTGRGGTAFELTPSGDNWMFALLYSFIGDEGPWGALTMDAAGDLYGTTFQDGAYGWGSVFKLTHSSGGWTYTDLHDFTGGDDGRGPYGNVILDVKGNLYGTTYTGGTYSDGVVWEITP